MTTFAIEMILAVEDYAGDFDECANATDDVIAAMHALADSEGTTCNVLSVEFIEFDSSNPSHACAYFEVEYECDRDLDDVEDE
jgi:hypothetical protein